MKLLIGACAALLLLLSCCLWGLKNAWMREADMAGELGQVKDALGRVEDRFGRLDKAVVGLDTQIAKNAKQLKITLKEIDDVKKTPRDTAQQMACLDVPVPAELDRILLNGQPAAGPGAAKPAPGAGESRVGGGR